MSGWHRHRHRPGDTPGGSHQPGGDFHWPPAGTLTWPRTLSTGKRHTMSVGPTGPAPQHEGRLMRCRIGIRTPSNCDPLISYKEGVITEHLGAAWSPIAPKRQRDDLSLVIFSPGACGAGRHLVGNVLKLPLQGQGQGQGQGQAQGPGRSHTAARSQLGYTPTGAV
jgi:hypothetical protein